MATAFITGRGSLAVAAILAVGSTCTTRERPAATSAREALTTANGLAQNGLTTNGIWANGIWANGIWANGIWANGIWANGIWANGIWANGIWANGIWANGIWANGIWANGIWANGLTGDAAVPGNALRNSVYARQLLQYIYSCAMPGTTYAPDGSVVSSYDTTLDPNGGTLTCTPGPDADAQCGGGYTCSAGGTCVVSLHGAIGLGVNADGSTWWETGDCDESCQRWVSSCVLARTNAYGVHVEISMRAPVDAPPEHELQFAKIRAALATTSDELATFSLREGAFYGNLFATTPLDPATGLPAPYPGTDGATTGPIADTPRFNACAGPGSNIPAITKRFCSSQGDQSVINVPGICVTTALETGVCDGFDSAGSVHGCNGQGTHYDEVITVHLRQPMAVCGNAVCEAGESKPADPGYCASDCHPDTWARSLAGDLWFDGNSSSAIDPIDSSTIVAGVELATTELLVDGTVSPPITLPADPRGSNDDWDIVLVKFAADGTYLWGKRYPAGVGILTLDALVVVAPDQSISLAVRGFNSIPQKDQLWYVNFRPDGTLASPWPVTIATGSSFNQLSPRVARVDSNGDLVVGGNMKGSATFGNVTLTSSTPNTTDAFVVKVCGSDRVDCVQGDVEWTTLLAGESFPNAIAIDGNDDVVLITAVTGAIVKLSGLTGATMWSKIPPGVRYVTVGSDPRDPSRDVYAAGIQGQLIKYSGDGTTIRWQSSIRAGVLGALGRAVTFDEAGNLVIGGEYRGIVDFGSGSFNAYASTYLYLAAHRPNDGAFLWAKNTPVILGGSPGGGGNTYHMLLDRDARGHLVFAGGYSGSMQLDDQMLVNTMPVLSSHPNTFIGSFRPPSPLDTTAPAIGVGADNGTQIDTLPNDIYTPATGPTGAVVFFMPPTAIDTGYAGTSVTCSPRPNTMFPIGTTTVTCTAFDPLGNSSSATFRVTVADTIGPVFSPAAAVTVQATSGSGASVPYTPPTATDQIGGASPVTCTPPSGHLFAVGTTTVTCTAMDGSNNASQTTFLVNVTPPPLQYEWSGILQPIDADGSSVFRLGSTVPVKFRLVGASAGITNLVANLLVSKITSAVTGTDVEAVSTAAATTGNAFRYDPVSGQYVFNLSTKSLLKGTWRLSIDMHDGVARTVNISLR